MKVEPRDGSVVVTLSAAEVKLLRLALERASFIDTPVSEQPKILAFCETLLDDLPT